GSKEEIRRGKGKMDGGTPQRPMVMSNNSTLDYRGNTFPLDERKRSLKESSRLVPSC
ncbi:hypothetical protein A2U01_0104716, partial [Trifolium medium]|nr:hypothetical protein [Trifolium medium]